MPHLFRKLGTLEEEIMNVVWRENKVSVRDVLMSLNKKRKVAYTTVMTVMVRLHEKEILKRFRDKSGAYVYEPTRSKQSFLKESSKKAVQKIVREYGEVAVAQFIDVVETSNRKELAEWRRKLKKLK